MMPIDCIYRGIEIIDHQYESILLTSQAIKLYVFVM
nr:MAG TPA: hypothetical protein [Caudoviricetes sp.]